jgi:hypothetical protein
VIEEIRFGAINIHDLTLSEDMLKTTKVFNKGDILINDRGFMSRELMNYLKTERGVDTYIPLRENMNAMDHRLRCPETGAAPRPARSAAPSRAALSSERVHRVDPAQRNAAWRPCPRHAAQCARIARKRNIRGEYVRPHGMRLAARTGELRAIRHGIGGDAPLSESTSAERRSRVMISASIIPSLRGRRERRSPAPG